ncbi:Obtusifoliol 14-alpha demethylase [Dichanthelium oligosanthes]|uniref:Obtusifoliol 14-alpha demethylase n=1 Tax=Dichanthelium oligosanthes TaxID=888268 RepID=A0A1E5VPM3_9POAL|nr:Obtusifoliol 14-alpha demethylase [Dichanthelium oligosanthes]
MTKLPGYSSMDLTNSAVWFAIALVFITAVITKIARGRTVADPVCNKSPPPVVSGGSLIWILHTFLTKGMRAMIHEQYTQLGSVFTISFFGWKVTFLAGPEVLGHFHQGLESEISLGDMLQFTVPMFGKEVIYGVDIATRCEQIRFYKNALQPPKLRSHADPMVQEVEDYFSKWDKQGTIDLKWELAQLLMLISSRCLLGREVREKMFKEVYTLFHELSDNGLRLTSVLFPYAPTLANYRRDRAHAKLSEMFTKIVRSRKSSNRVERDVLQSLIDSKYKDNRPTTEAEVIGLILNLMFAGMHTSSAASTWTGVCLLSHERCLRVVVEEQKQIVQKYGDHMDYNALMEMDTLHRCIKETLRMHPPTPATFRKVHKSFTVRTREGYEYEIPRGHTVASPIHFNSNIPYIYKNPDVYDPDRFGPGREEDRVGGKFSYTAFSGGRHACIGEAYAYMQIKVIWSHLLRNFELKLVSPFPETDRSKLALEPKGKVMVHYKRLADA